MNQVEDQAYFVVKDTSQRTKSTLSESQMVLDAGWRDAAKDIEMPIDHIRRFVDIDKELDPLRFIDFPALRLGMRRK